MSLPRHAIILAAGSGARLRSVVDDRPKGLIEIGGEPLVGRSVRLLRSAGIAHITIVAGYLADHYHRYADLLPDIRIVINDCFETTGSMASLAVALDAVQDDVLVLESDIIFEARALTAVADARSTDVTLISGPTAAGDEVWVAAPDGMLEAMSKHRDELKRVDGEFVGITRIGSATAAAMLDAYRAFHAAHGHGRMDYETGALVRVARSRRIEALLIPDLCWGEIDDERQFVRVTQQIWPALAVESPCVTSAVRTGDRWGSPATGAAES